MNKLISLLAFLVLSWSQAAFAVAAPVEASDESGLRQQVQAASWPAEIVRLAGRYVDRYPQAAWAAEAASARDRAAAAVRALNSKGATLQRLAFAQANHTPEVQADMRLAALADAEAALRLAKRYQHGSDQMPVDLFRHVGWLQFSAMLGNETAAYDLALHYRREGQPAMAAVYETRAVALGFTPPPALDHIRK